MTPPRASWICKLLVILCSVLCNKSEPTDYCHFDTFQPDCGSGQVVMVESALYGRMEYNRCVDRNYGYVGCFNDVTLMADLRCSGRRSCKLALPDKNFGLTTPCPKDLSKYLTIDYRCQPVYTPPGNCLSGSGLELSDPSGILASVTTDESGCGSTGAPWIIKGKPGQTVSITLMDFAVKEALLNDTSPDEDRSGLLDDNCHVYAIVKELPSMVTENPTIKQFCGGKARVREIFTSRSSEIELRVMTRQSGRKRHFLLEYKIQGCPDLDVPIGGWIKRNDDVTTAGCREGDTKWRLTCEGNKWDGNLGNCSSAIIQGLNPGYASFTQTLSIVVILAVALGIGATILCVGLVCIRRRRRMTGAPEESYTATHPQLLGNTKDSLYRTANSTYNGYTPPSSTARHHDPSEENDYEYVDDFKPVAPSGDPKSRTVVPVAAPVKEKCLVRQTSGGGASVVGHNPYTRYGTTMDDDIAVSKQHQQQHMPVSMPPPPQPPPQQQQHAPSHHHPMPPQYFELDPEVLTGPKTGNVFHHQGGASVGVTAHGGSQNANPSDTSDPSEQKNFSFGHYSQ